MTENKALYDGEPREKWLNGLSETDGYNARHLLAIFARMGIPGSMLDVGSGSGAMVRTARKLGVQAYGVDQLVDETWEDYFYHQNLVDFFQLPEQVDMVTSFEVAEHIYWDGHPTIVKTMAENLKPGGGHYIIFSAARPGQNGTGHVFTRAAEYWHKEFEYYKCTYCDSLTMNLALLASRIYTPLNYFSDNLMVFEKP